MPDVVNWFVKENEFRYILLDEFIGRIAAQMRDIIHAASDEIINADDLVPAGQQKVSQMGAEKTGRAGNDRSGLFFAHL